MTNKTIMVPLTMEELRIASVALAERGDRLTNYKYSKAMNAKGEQCYDLEEKLHKIRTDWQEFN